MKAASAASAMVAGCSIRLAVMKNGQKAFQGISQQGECGGQFSADSQHVGCAGVAGARCTRVFKPHGSAYQNGRRHGAGKIGKDGHEKGGYGKIRAEHR